MIPATEDDLNWHAFLGHSLDSRFRRGAPEIPWRKAHAAVRAYLQNSSVGFPLPL